MRSNLRKLFGLALFVVAVGAAVSAFGQTRTGGYRSVSVNDEDVRDAADFALEIKDDEIDEDFSLESIVKAEKQTVSGTNYRLCLKILILPKGEETGGVTNYIRTVIFRSLQGEYSIKSWVKTAGCGKK